jgi:hypothetical protein
VLKEQWKKNVSFGEATTSQEKITMKVESAVEAMSNY